MKKIFFIFLLIILSVIITYFSGLVPINGIEIQKIKCGDPAGLPFAFYGTWRGDGVHVMCVLTAMPLSISFFLDVIFWFFILLFAFKLSKKLFSKKM